MSWRIPLRKIAEFYRSSIRVNKTSAIVLAAGIALLGAGYGMEVYNYNQQFEKNKKQLIKEHRKADLEKRMFQTISKKYHLSPSSVCNSSQPMFRKGQDNFVVVHGSDSRPYYMGALKLDVGAWVEMARHFGYNTIEVCSDVHDKNYWDSIMDSLTSSSDDNSSSGLFISAHGITSKDSPVKIQYQGGSDSGSERSGSAETVTITSEDINRHIRKLKGKFEGFFDNCYAIDDLVKGTQVDSSDVDTPSYWATNVPMGYFTLAMAYTMIVEDYSSTFEEVARRMAEKDPSLPDEVLQLMDDHPKAFSTITIRENGKGYCGEGG